MVVAEALGPRAVLCVCTHRRPAELERLLEGIDRLEVAAELAVVVVDNDPREQQGLAACAAFAAVARRRWRLTASLEPRPGISFARNHAVVLALTEQPDFIAMLDDDEVPTATWLAELLRVQEVTDADLVGGPVLPLFPANARPFSQLADYYGADLRVADGAACVLHASGNFMVRASRIEELLPEPFDTAFALSGGEDMVFFRRLADRGCTMRWAASAIVHEPVAAERLRLAWLLRRQLRRGSLNVLVQRMFRPGPLQELIRLAKTAGLVAAGLGWGAVAWPHPIARLRALMLVGKALGKIQGHFGRRPEEYAAARRT